LSLGRRVRDSLAHYIALRMKRSFIAVVVSVAIVFTVLTAASLATPSSVASPEVSHVLRPTAGDLAGMKAAFLKFKVQNHWMLRTDRVRGARVVSSNLRNRPDMAYDAVDHREWAIASFELVYPASFTAEVWFQDGGGMGIFNKVGSGKWFMIGSPIVPYCGEGLPSVVVHLWQFNIYPGCA
jgi:hypothetical protein